ncbi:hypothetical protein [Stratiformator vulcanicus]|uniref:Response regulatory domain-containing protein n=1 Tax=Stratiformator vulcanicus TaxID=2527980 RepID=A0A517QZX1_9PLAN|nr:hypothetical protein [Stratiformator vulcanicus]QDT37114.1 hypothetical protein Pan189_14820 [Stratiformator vulcanicus]
MPDTSHVLLIDGLEETAEVVRAVLKSSGSRVTRMRSYELPSRLQNDADVVIYHDSGVRDASGGADTNSRIVVGRVNHSDPTACPSVGASELAEPFDYRDLIGAVHRCLAESQSESPARAA